MVATGSGAGDALAELCVRYWMPIYASLRRQGFASAEAEDLVQGFFLHLIEQGTVARAERERGRFRNFMLGALRRFLGSESERERALKRGSDCHFVPFDAATMESLLPVTDESALSLDLQFDREWARTLIDNAVGTLREQHVREGDGELFDALRACLDPGAGVPTYVELARRLGRSEGAVKTAVHRLRRRFRDVLRREVACTVAAADEVEAELAHLRDVLSTGPAST
ncbi:MAG: hypothetical protein M0Q70_00700 [Dokdonella sp.]|nr:hypothetical protein [Dokdonella sp.]